MVNDKVNVNIISDIAIRRRLFWVDEIVTLSGKFKDDFARVEKELSEEIGRDGTQAILDHLHLSGEIPESYGHDSSEEKLYSKYTDALIAACFVKIGLKAIVLTERADAADVEAVVEDYSFVADAKAFRLSRTAKNQKDFKVQAMDGWKRGKPFALVVCPLHQLPAKASQIYQQAAAKNVCVFSYSHLAVLVRVSDAMGENFATHLLHEIFKTVLVMNPSKDANQYWMSLNRMMMNYHECVSGFWQIEKRATLEALAIAKNHALTFLANERKRMMMLSHEEAIKQLLLMNKIEGRIRVIETASTNDLMSVL